MIDAARTHASPSTTQQQVRKGEGGAFNGNITELQRYAGGTQIDDLEYFYNHDNHTDKLGLASNRLYRVNEDAASTSGDDLQPFNYGKPFDKNDPSSWNYNYDPIGNLVKDTSEGISLINWTVTSKVSDVIFKVDLPNNSYNLTFRYDPMGNRIAKIKKPHNSLANCTTWTVTWYARDAQGNVLAVYNKPENSTAFSATEFNIYGSSRIGMVTQPEALNENPADPVAHSQTLGNKVYEFSNHLGNVLTTFSDRKIPTEGDPGLVAYYNAEILSSTDYFPFGFEMPGRSFTGANYRYGFQGQEDNPEVYDSESTSIYFKYRIHDTRIGKFLSVDPLFKQYPWNSTFAFAENRPIDGYDLEGREWDQATDDQGNTHISVNVNFSFNLDQNMLPEGTTTEDYLEAFSNQFNTALELSSSGSYTGQITFKSVVQTSQVVPSVSLYATPPDPNADIMIEGMAAFGGVGVNIYNKDGTIKTPNEVAEVLVHELFHTIRVAHPFDKTQATDTQLVHDQRDNYLPTSSTDPNILFNIMNYSLTMINGKSVGNSPQLLLTQGQLLYIVEQINLQKQGFGTNREDFWDYWLNTPGEIVPQCSPIIE